jgi:hypothetical protein
MYILLCMVNSYIHQSSGGHRKCGAHEAGAQSVGQAHSVDGGGTTRQMGYGG